MKQILPFVVAIAASFFVWSCEKTPNSVQSTNEVSNNIENDVVDRDNCPTEFRIMSIPPFSSNVSYHNEFAFTRPFAGGFFLTRVRSTCQASNIQMGVWQPISMIAGIQYALNYTYLPTCGSFGIGTCNVEIRCGTNTLIRNITTNSNGVATLPYYRVGCQVLEGWKE
jgi:hypothetical protein